MACRWKETLTDAAVVHWTLSEANVDDPKRMIYDLMACAEQWALDPAISHAARRLVQRGIAQGVAMAKRTRDMTNHEIEEKIEELLSLFAGLPADRYKEALEEMQSRATSSLEAFEAEQNDADEVEEDGDDKDTDSE